MKSNINKFPTGTNEKSSINERELRREYHFRKIIQSHLIDTLQDSLEDSGFSELGIDEFMVALEELPENDQLTVLAVPFEIRERFFGKYFKKVEDGEISMNEVVEDILKNNRQYGHTLGYHLSDKEIPIERNNKGETWNIKGDEFDDRDNMKMSYYSEDYKNRYKKKFKKFLYVVRSEVGPNSSHKRDLSNHWGRAPLLSIISKFDMQKIDDDIDEEIKKENAATDKK